MKFIISILLIIVSVTEQLVAQQLNLTAPSKDNNYIWILAQNNNPSITYEKVHHDKPGMLYVLHIEKMNDWNCRQLEYSSPKAHMHTISLEDFNTNYRSKCITSINVRQRYKNDCVIISDTLGNRDDLGDGFITYFVIEGNQVTVYNKTAAGTNYVEAPPAWTDEEWEELNERLRRIRDQLRGN